MALLRMCVQKSYVFFSRWGFPTESTVEPSATFIDIRGMTLSHYFYPLRMNSIPPLKTLSLKLPQSALSVTIQPRTAQEILPKTDPYKAKKILPPGFLKNSENFPKAGQHLY